MHVPLSAISMESGCMETKGIGMAKHTSGTRRYVFPWSVQSLCSLTGSECDGLHSIQQHYGNSISH